MRTRVTAHDGNDELMRTFFKMAKIAGQEIALTGYLSLVMARVVDDQECTELQVVVPRWVDFSELGIVMNGRKNYELMTDDGIYVEIKIEAKYKYSYFDYPLGGNNYHKIRIAKFV